MKAETPATIPASIVSARAGLDVISAKIVTPAGTDIYSEFANNEPMMNNNGIAMTSPTDHLPDVDFGVILNGCFVMLSSITAEDDYYPDFASTQSFLLAILVREASTGDVGGTTATSYAVQRLGQRLTLYRASQRARHACISGS